MSKEEFNLSECIIESDGYFEEEVVLVEDVKEFIRLLKKEAFWISGASQKVVLIEDIDILAGEKLK